MVTDVPPDAVEFVENRDVDVISHGRRYQVPVAFNSRRAPFNSPTLRRALNYAVDRSALIRDVFKGRGRPSTGPLWPRHWAYDSGVSPYTYDPGLATSLLENGGFPVDTRIGRPNTRVSFTCLIPENFTLLERLGLAVQRQLYDIGVDMQFEVVPAREFDRRIREGRFQAILVDMVSGPSFGRSYLFWASAASFKGLNVFGYENIDAERLFSVLRTSTNEAAVRSATRSLQRVLLDDPPALFLVWTERSRAVRREFQVVREPDGDPVSTIWRWAAADRSAESIENRAVKKISTRFALLLALAAVLPLLGYGVVSILSLRTGGQQAIIQGNLNVARRAAEQIEQYVTSSIRILKAVSADLQQTGLEPWQQDRILKNFVLEFPEYRELTLLDESGRPVVSSSLGKPTVGVPGSEGVTIQGALMSRFSVDNDLLPTAVVAVPLSDIHGGGFLVGRLNLEEMWRMVDRIRVGERGYASVVTSDGLLLAHGDPDQKSRVARGDNLLKHPLIEQLLARPNDAVASAQYP